MKRVVIKIGSRVITKKNGLLDESAVASLVADVDKIKKEKRLEIILVTSGAVAVGRGFDFIKNLKIDAGAVNYNKKIIREQIMAAVGQPKLMSLYIAEFQKYGIDCAQILATRSDFADREKYLSMRTVTKNLLNAGIVPIFNENDVLSPEELDFSDNDQLAVTVSAMAAADKLIILSVADGFLDGPIDDPKTKTIPIIENLKKYLKLVDDSNIAKGGMASKLRSADLAASLGIEAHISSGARKNAVSSIIEGKKCGTIFPAKNKKQKALKNWIAAGAVSRGEIRVNARFADILRAGKVVSVLPAGIEGIGGKFRKKDVVDIVDENGSMLARGIARFSSTVLLKEVDLCKRNKKQGEAMPKCDKSITVNYDQMVLYKSD